MESHNNSERSQRGDDVPEQSSFRTDQKESTESHEQSSYAKRRANEASFVLQRVELFGDLRTRLEKRLDRDPQLQSLVLSRRLRLRQASKAGEGSPTPEGADDVAPVRRSQV